MAGNNEQATQAAVPIVCLYESDMTERSLWSAQIRANVL
jgi:hypothetical protein